MANAADVKSNAEAGTQTDFAQAIDAGTQTEFGCPHCDFHNHVTQLRVFGKAAKSVADKQRDTAPHIQPHVHIAADVDQIQDSVHNEQPAAESPNETAAQPHEPPKYNLRSRAGKDRDSQATSQRTGEGAKRRARLPDATDERQHSERQNQTSTSEQSDDEVQLTVRRRKLKKKSQPKRSGSQFILSAQQLSDESEPSSSEAAFIVDEDSDEAPARTRRRRRKSAVSNDSDGPLVYVLSDDSAGVVTEKPKRRRLTKHGNGVKDNDPIGVAEKLVKEKCPESAETSSKVQSTMAERIRANKQRVLSQALEPVESQSISSDEEEPGKPALNSGPEDSCSGDSLDGFVVKEGSDAEGEANGGAVDSNGSEDECKAGVDDSYHMYLKYHLLSLLDGHFRMVRHTDAAPLHEGVRRVENQLSIHRESLVSSSAWKEDFRRALDSRPMYFSREVGDLTEVGTCEACGRSNHPARLEVSLSGAACNVSTFWASYYATTSQSAAPSETPDKFYVGVFCHARTHLWHELHFYPWRLRLGLQHYLQNHVATSEKWTPRDHAKMVLADQVYVAHLYDNYKALLERSQRYMEDNGRKGRRLPTSIAGQDLFTLTHAIEGSEGRVISVRDWQRWLSRHILKDNMRQSRQNDSSGGDEEGEGKEEEDEEEQKGEEVDEDDEIEEIAGPSEVPIPDNKRSAQEIPEEDGEHGMPRRVVGGWFVEKKVASPRPQRRLSAALSRIEDDDVSPSAGLTGGPRKVILDDDDEDDDE
eukprot:jgi/Chlat1/697/Chrsp104S01162